MNMDVELLSWEGEHSISYRIGVGGVFWRKIKCAIREATEDFLKV